MWLTGVRADGAGTLINGIEDYQPSSHKTPLHYSLEFVHVNIKIKRHLLITES